MVSGKSGSIPHWVKIRRNRKPLILGGSVLLGIVLFCLIACLILKDFRSKLPEPPAPEPIAELANAVGMVLVQNSGKSEWREVKAGAPLMEGDLLRTDNSGEAGIRYRSGTTISIPEQTVFTLRKMGENRIEISVPPEATGLPPLLLAGENGISGTGAKSGASRLMELQQIIPFGRSLELIGRVEAGSNLTVNDEIVEVAGDGSFKHFTKQFPASAHKARLDMKVTDLAGRVRIWTATHQFTPDGADN
jgi:hypothetical protein